MNIDMKKVFDNLGDDVTVEADNDYIEDIVDFLEKHFRRANTDGEQIICVALMAMLENLLSD